ncbi:MAG: PIN domain-containing protein [Anaerolineae bacterium]
MADKLCVVVDLSVVLDVIQQRAAHYTDSARILDAVVREEIKGVLAAHSITTLFYVITRWQNRKVAVTALTGLLDVFTIAAVDNQVIRKALSWGWKDLEDAVQMAAALAAGVDYIITRNKKDFQAQPVPVLAPVGLLALLAQK